MATVARTTPEILRFASDDGFLFNHTWGKTLRDGSSNMSGIKEGETLHSSRSVWAITLALSGAQLAYVMSHVGWKNGQAALYYMKLEEVLNKEMHPSCFPLALTKRLIC